MKKSLIIILIAFPSIYFAKNYNLGLRLEFFTYNLEKYRDYDLYSSEFEFSYLPGFYVFYSHQINERISLIIKPGFFFSGDGKFNGFDIGGFFRSNFKTNNFYLTCGLNYIGLNVSEGNTPELESNPYFLSLGVGYNIDEHVNVDLGYYHNLNKRIGTSYIDLNSENQIEKPLNLYNMFKLSIEFSL